MSNVQSEHDDMSRMTLLQHTCKLRNQTLTVWLSFMVGGVIWIFLFGGIATETPPASFLQGCTTYCISNMPNVCDKRWSCDSFCTNGFFQNSITVEMRNNQQYLTRNKAEKCLPQCHNHQVAVCHGQMSCDKFCDHVHFFNSDEDNSISPKGSFFDTRNNFVYFLILIDLFYSCIRLRHAYNRVTHENKWPIKPSQITPTAFEDLLVDSATFYCGIVIITRCFVESALLYGSNKVGLTTMFVLIIMDELLQVTSSLLKTPHDVFIHSILLWIPRTILGRYNGTVCSVSSSPTHTSVPTQSNRVGSKQED